MEPISKALKGMANRGDFQSRYNQIKQQVLKNENIRNFILENENDVTSETIERSLNKLYEYTTQSINCKGCPSLSECNNLVEGYHPNLILQGKIIDLQYEKCPTKVAYDERRKNESLIKSMYIPKDILKAQMNDISLSDPSRLKVVSLGQDFVEQYKPGRQQKALFIHGRFGVGKTYILGALANELAQKRVSSMLVYVPEFFRELKSSIGNNTMDEKLEVVKTVPVLMLDDIGAESMTSWMRDEILGTILQYRMLENLPTFFSSNFNFAELQHHFTYTQRGEQEQVKAARIMERIKYLTTPVELKGENRREN